MSDIKPIHVGSYRCAEHRIVGFSPEPSRKSGLVRTAKRLVFLPDPDQPKAPEALSELGPAEFLAASEDGAVEATAFGRVVQWRTRQPDRRQQVVLPEAVQVLAFDGLTERIVAISGDGLWAIDPNTGTYRQAAELPWLGVFTRLRHPWNRINLTEQAGTYVFGNGRERCAVVRGTMVENVVLPHRCLCAWGSAEGAVSFLCARDSKLLVLASPSTELWRADLPAPVVEVTACPGGATIAGILKDGAAFLRGQEGKMTWFPRHGPVQGIALTRRGLEAQLLIDNAVHRYFLGTAHKKVAQEVDHRGKNIQGTIAACREELDATTASLAAQKSRILVLRDAAKHGRTVVDKERDKTGKEQDQLTKQASGSPDAMERAEAAAILPLINDQMEHLQLQHV